MIFEQNELCEIYVNLFNWLAGHSSGKSHAYKSYHNSMDKKIWKPLFSKIEEIQIKETKTKEEIDFLEKVIYRGDMHRLQIAKKMKNGYIDRRENYFSWSKTINGVTAKPLSYCGNCLHILANTKNEYAFDVFGFLYHIITYRYKFIPSQDYDIRILCRYEEEEEIVFPVAKNTIISVSIENVKDLSKYPNNNLIKENEWFRK